MAGKKHTSLDRVLGRLDSLDSVSLTNLVQRLARERALLEEIFNTLQEGVLVIAADGTIEYANDAAHRLMGLSGDRLDGQTLWRLVPGLRPSLGGDAERRRPGGLARVRALVPRAAHGQALHGRAARGGRRGAPPTR